MHDPRNQAALHNLLCAKGLGEKSVEELLVFIGRKCGNGSTKEGVAKEATLRDYCSRKGVDKNAATADLDRLRSKGLLEERGERLWLGAGLADLF